MIQGTTVFVGRACPGDPAVPRAPAGPGDFIAVVERDVCDFTVKVAAVIAAGGYDAVLVFNRTGTDACDGSAGMSVAGDIVTVGVAPRSSGFAIFDVAYSNADCLAGKGPALLPVAVGTTGDVLSIVSQFDGWGYVHLFDNSTGRWPSSTRTPSPRRTIPRSRPASATSRCTRSPRRN